MELKRPVIGRLPRHSSSLPAVSVGRHGIAEPLRWQQKVPQRLPWATSGDGVTQFTASERGTSRGLKSKRRSEKPESAPVSKQCLTEDMMAAHFTSLSLDNDHAYTSSGFPTAPLLARRRHCAPSVSGRRNSDSDSALPLVDALRSQYEHFRQTEESYPSCSELVLWKPPGSFIPEVIRSLSHLENQDKGQNHVRSREAPPSPSCSELPFPVPTDAVLQAASDAMELS
ncbi:host cell factor C1 regulator 1 isoform X2 [Amia ocellicauda]|uniref:host cell factor C1 regulator 1 isoform X2 n=1 Tax=Amia ocellicauda TaxID=2972642 RepID=UPI0034645641